MAKAAEASYRVQLETLDSLQKLWQRSGHGLRWDCLFVLPAWLKAWWRHFGNGSRPLILSVFSQDKLLGIAPLQAEGHRVQFMGDPGVCDYLDFVVFPERADDFYQYLLHYLKQEGYRQLDLSEVRPDSSAFTDLIPVAMQMEFPVLCEAKDVSFEMRLPRQWDQYLLNLSGKARHEIRRKLRRLNEAGQVNYRLVDQRAAVEGEINTFLTLFRANRSDKAGFMNEQMSSFFKDLAALFAKDGIIKLFFLELDGAPVASVMCFDYRSTRYLYNNGYDQQYRSLSVGTLSKVLSIQDSIHSNQAKFDFLKGPEIYKHRLGGKPVPVYQCIMDLG